MFNMISRHERKRIPTPRRFFFFSCLSFFILTSGNISHSQDRFDLIFVQVPAAVSASGKELSRFYPPSAVNPQGTRIVLLPSASAQPINLTPEFFAACDPDISFDGKTIIFAGKKGSGDRWQIWQMNTDGSDKKQITHSTGDCITPVHAGNRFYLDDPQPTPQIIYAGNEHGWMNQWEAGPIFALYGTDPDGNAIHRLTFNLYSDYGPDVLPSGRIVFTSWQSRGEPALPGGQAALLAINNDGTDLLPYYGNHELPMFKEMVHVSDYDERIYFIESDVTAWPGGGKLASLSQRRHLHSYRKLSGSGKGIFHSAVALPEGGLLASYRIEPANSLFGIYRIDAKTGKVKDGIFEESGWHSLDPQLLRERPPVKGKANWLIPGSRQGVFYCLNSYLTHLPGMESLEEQSIRYLRVIEGIPLVKENRGQAGETMKIEGSMPHEAALQTQIPQRILGVAPVQEDGSFHIQVPAEIPLKFQLLDRDYIALRSQKAWTWVMGNENRGCIGCHEDRELSPPNILAQAVIQPAVQLTLPPERRRMVDFRHQVAPILNARCATTSCHVSGKSYPDLHSGNSDQADRAVRQIYRTLLGLQPDPTWPPLVIPGDARGSPLIWYLFGKRLKSAPVVYPDDISLMPPDGNLRLDERILLIEWVDLGAPWDLIDLTGETGRGKTGRINDQ